MGRGISPLQDAMLELAWRNRQAGTGGKRTGEHHWQGADVHYHELIAGHYGVPVAWRHFISDWPAFSAYDPRVASARAALSRAAARLENRGLVYHLRGRSWAGIVLTEAGAAFAEGRYMGTVS